MQTSCPQCGAQTGPGQQYCQGCGAAVIQGAANYQLPPSPYYPPAQKKSGPALACLIAGCVILLLLILVAGLASLALPNYVKVKEKAKEAEVKADLHSIQLSVERFAVDHNGEYPEYLIGGEAKYAATLSGSTDERQEQNFFTDIKEVPDPKAVSDPLIRAGYIDGYPRNPFTRDGVAIHQLQENLPTSRHDGADPLRSGADGATLGTRFGAHCDLMGSVLADPRYTKWSDKSGKAGPSGDQPTYADIEYQFWDMWAGDKPLPYLPGQFWYKSAGNFDSFEHAELSKLRAPFPKYVELYMLGGYGGIRTKGKDVLGEERPITCEVRNKTVSFWSWTRSQVSTDPNALEGCPFTPPGPGDNSDQLLYGNPNGIRDGIILMLTAGDTNW